MRCAQSAGIVVENVAYSPDSVADYTLMLMLMVVRNAKSTISRVQVHDYRLNDGAEGAARHDHRSRRNGTHRRGSDGQAAGLRLPRTGL